MKVINGVATLHLVDPYMSIKQTFGDYTDKLFMPDVKNELKSVHHLDIVWETYKADNLKSAAWHGSRDASALEFRENTCIPMSWKGFLMVDTNKMGLIDLIV